MRVGSCSISSSIPVPSFEDILNISSSLDPIKLCICLETLSISTSTESILLMTGIISNPASIAAYECAKVCA